MEKKRNRVWDHLNDRLWYGTKEQVENEARHMITFYITNAVNAHVGRPISDAIWEQVFDEV